MQETRKGYAVDIEVGNVHTPGLNVRANVEGDSVLFVVVGE